VRIPEAQIAQIVDRLEIVDVVAEYTALRPRGGRHWGLCPFHTEKTPSFTVSPDKSAFYCFGCGKGGGLIQFVMDVEQIPFPEAVRMLAERAGVQLETEQRPAGAITRREYVELNRRLADTFRHVLRTSAEAAAARAYLAQRGIGQQAAAAFKLGWAPAERGWLLRFLRGKQFSAQFLAQSGLFGRRGGDGQELAALFHARLMFPIANARGEVLAFGGRTLAAEGVPKYVNSAETPFFRKQEQMFGLNHALPPPDELIAEYAAAYGDEPGDIGWYRALAAYKFGVISGFNLMLHRTGKRPDESWEQTALSIPGLMRRALALLG